MYHPEIQDAEVTLVPHFGGKMAASSARLSCIAGIITDARVVAF